MRQRRARAMDSSARTATTDGAHGPTTSAMRYACCAFCRSAALTSGIVTTGAIEAAFGTPTCSRVEVRAGTGIVTAHRDAPLVVELSVGTALHDGDELGVHGADAARPGRRDLRARDEGRRLGADRRLERLLDRGLQLDDVEDALHDAVGQRLLDLRLG